MPPHDTFVIWILMEVKYMNLLRFVNRLINAVWSVSYPILLKGLH